MNYGVKVIKVKKFQEKHPEEFDALILKISKIVPHGEKISDLLKQIQKEEFGQWGHVNFEERFLALKKVIIEKGLSYTKACEEIKVTRKYFDRNMTLEEKREILELCALHQKK